MKSILDGRPVLAAEVAKAAEVAGYLWEKGWAERNGGNITLNLTELVDDEIRNMPALQSPVSFGIKLHHLKGCYFYCKGTNKRMRDLASSPMEHGSIVRICDDCESYEIIADSAVKPTSEITAHLSMHNYLLSIGSSYRAAIHTHPIELIAMTHNREFMKKDLLSRLLWSMIPETRAFCPKGLGVVPYCLPGSTQLATSTVEQLGEYDVVMWEKHGACAVGVDVVEAFDQIDVLSKSALIYISSKNMGFSPEGMTDEQMDEMKEVFGL